MRVNIWVLLACLALALALACLAARQVLTAPPKTNHSDVPCEIEANWEHRFHGRTYEFIDTSLHHVTVKLQVRAVSNGKHRVGSTNSTCAARCAHFSPTRDSVPTVKEFRHVKTYTGSLHGLQTKLFSFVSLYDPHPKVSRCSFNNSDTCTIVAEVIFPHDGKNGSIFCLSGNTTKELDGRQVFPNHSFGIPAYTLPSDTWQQWGSSPYRLGVVIILLLCFQCCYQKRANRMENTRRKRCGEARKTPDLPIDLKTIVFPEDGQLEGLVKETWVSGETEWMRRRVKDSDTDLVYALWRPIFEPERGIWIFLFRLINNSDEPVTIVLTFKKLSNAEIVGESDTFDESLNRVKFVVDSGLGGTDRDVGKLVEQVDARKWFMPNASVQFDVTCEAKATVQQQPSHVPSVPLRDEEASTPLLSGGSRVSGPSTPGLQSGGQLPPASSNQDFKEHRDPHQELPAIETDWSTFTPQILSLFTVVMPVIGILSAFAYADVVSRMRWLPDIVHTAHCNGQSASHTQQWIFLGKANAIRILAYQGIVLTVAQIQLGWIQWSPLAHKFLKSWSATKLDGYDKLREFTSPVEALGTSFLFFARYVLNVFALERERIKAKISERKEEFEETGSFAAKEFLKSLKEAFPDQFDAVKRSKNHSYWVHINAVRLTVFGCQLPAITIDNWLNFWSFGLSVLPRCWMCIFVGAPLWPTLNVFICGEMVMQYWLIVGLFIYNCFRFAKTILRLLYEHVRDYELNCEQMHILTALASHADLGFRHGNNKINLTEALQVDVGSESCLQLSFHSIGQTAADFFDKDDTFYLREYASQQTASASDADTKLKELTSNGFEKIRFICWKTVGPHPFVPVALSQIVFIDKEGSAIQSEDFDAIAPHGNSTDSEWPDKIKEPNGVWRDWARAPLEIHFGETPRQIQSYTVVTDKNGDHAPLSWSLQALANNWPSAGMSTWIDLHKTPSLGCPLSTWEKTVDGKFQITFQVEPRFTQKAPINKLNLHDKDQLQMWWWLRAYTLLDLTDERIAMDMLLSMCLFWILLLLVGAFVTYCHFHRVTVLSVVTVYVTLIFSSFALRAVQSCSRMNQMCAGHAAMLERVRSSAIESLAPFDAMQIHWLCDAYKQRIVSGGLPEKVLGFTVDGNFFFTVSTSLGSTLALTAWSILRPVLQSLFSGETDLENMAANFTNQVQNWTSGKFA